MRTKFFCTNFLNTARGPGHPGKVPGTSRIPLFKTQGRQSFEGGHEVFGHHPFAWKTPTPPGGLRTQKLNLCALLSCLILPIPEKERPKVCKTAFFAQKMCKSAALHTFRRFLFGIGGNPTFCAQINYLGISALWLVLKFTILALLLQRFFRNCLQ